MEELGRCDAASASLSNALHRRFAELSCSYHDRAGGGQFLSSTMHAVERVRFVTGRAFLRLLR